jgi:CRP/FNR family transcriptional regulator, cyclic AMP receptor protein
MAEPVDALAAVPLFAGLSKRDLRRLAGSMRERTFTEGKDVLSEGEGGVGFFVIVDGEARVSVRGREVRTLRAGDHFGEVALITGETRTATVTAGPGLRCLGMTAWDFRPWVKEHPDVAWALLETLARRAQDASTPS